MRFIKRRICIKLDAGVGPVGGAVEGGRLGGCGRQGDAFGLRQLQAQQAHCQVDAGEDDVRNGRVQSSPLSLNRE